MKRRAVLYVVAVLTALTTMLGLGQVPAFATITVNGGCSIGGYSFNGYATLNGGYFPSYTVKYSSTRYYGLEWRVHIFNLADGSSWDSGYNIGPGLNNITAHPNVIVGSPVNVTFYMGRYGDGYPTCELDINSVYN